MSFLLTSSHLNRTDIKHQISSLASWQMNFFSGQLAEGIKSYGWELPIDCCDQALILILTISPVTFTVTVSDINGLFNKIFFLYKIYSKLVFE